MFGNLSLLFCSCVRGVETDSFSVLKRFPASKASPNGRPHFLRLGRPPNVGALATQLHVNDHGCITTVTLNVRARNWAAPKRAPSFDLSPAPYFPSNCQLLVGRLKSVLRVARNLRPVSGRWQAAIRSSKVNERPLPFGGAAACPSCSQPASKGAPLCRDQCRSWPPLGLPLRRV